jgi:hypothetical protein
MAGTGTCTNTTGILTHVILLIFSMFILLWSMSCYLYQGLYLLEKRDNSRFGISTFIMLAGAMYILSYIVLLVVKDTTVANKHYSFLIGIFMLVASKIISIKHNLIKVLAERAVKQGPYTLNSAQSDGNQGVAEGDAGKTGPMGQE